MDRAKYEKQRKIWYAKLKKSGFEDIEFGNTSSQSDDYVGNMYLKPNPYQNILSNSKYKKAYGNGLPEQKKVHFQEKTEYYRLVGQFLYSHKFQSSIQEFVWEQHAVGKTLKEITSAVNKKFRSKRYSLQYVNKTIKQLGRIMMGRDTNE